MKIPVRRLFCCQSQAQEESVPQNTVMPSGYSVTSARNPSIDANADTASRRASGDTASRVSFSAPSRAASGVPIFNRTFISPFQKADQSIRHGETITRAESGELPTPEEINNFYALYGRLTRIEQRFNKRTNHRQSWNPPNNTVPSTSVFATKPAQVSSREKNK